MDEKKESLVPSNFKIQLGGLPLLLRPGNHPLWIKTLLPGPVVLPLQSHSYFLKDSNMFVAGLSHQLVSCLYEFWECDTLCTLSLTLLVQTDVISSRTPRASCVWHGGSLHHTGGSSTDTSQTTPSLRLASAETAEGIRASSLQRVICVTEHSDLFIFTREQRKIVWPHPWLSPQSMCS